jgi:hypothetical protein
MAYTIQAFIGRPDSLVLDGMPDAQVKELTDDLSILPLADPLPSQLGIGNLPLTDDHLEAVDAISRIGAQLSKLGRVVYVEAEYFGSGTQASCLFENGNLVKGPLLSQGAINEALRFLGVTAMQGADEFATVGLGKRQHTEDWLDDWFDDFDGQWRQ